MYKRQALATVLGQLLSALLAIYYLTMRFRTVSLNADYMRPRLPYLKAIVSLGAAPCFNQLAMAVVQITMNNTLRYYGALSMYGSDIPLACVGVISKVNIIYMAFMIGIAQGCQPITSFNYGAKNYERVKNTYKKAAKAVTIISIIAFCCFQLFPRQIISIFGPGDEAYFHFAERYFRIYTVSYTHLYTDDNGNPVMYASPSNLSPASDEYKSLVAERVAAIRSAHPEKEGVPIPVDLVTCSGSGLDPHISPAAAYYQAERLARNTGKTVAEVQSIIDQYTEGRLFGIFGEPRVNVLKVNLALDGILQ